MGHVMPYLGLGIVLASLAGLAVWLYSSSSRSGDKRREEMTSKRMAQQPWDAESADGRGNR